MSLDASINILQKGSLLWKLAKTRGFVGCMLIDGVFGKKYLHFVSREFDISDSIRYCVACKIDDAHKIVLATSLREDEVDAGELGWKKLLELMLIDSAYGYEHHCMMTDSIESEHDVVVLLAHSTLEKTLIELDLLDLGEL